MKILFRKKAPGFFSWAIRTLSRSKYSHVTLKPVGMQCISSNERHGGVGYEDVSGNPDKWDIYLIRHITPAEESVIAGWCASQIGSKYDWLGILQYTNIFRKNKTGAKDKWYCSEFCQVGLSQAIGRLVGRSVRNPGGLYRLLVELKIITPSGESQK